MRFKKIRIKKMGMFSATPSPLTMIFWQYMALGLHSTNGSSFHPTGTTSCGYAIPLYPHLYLYTFIHTYIHTLHYTTQHYTTLHYTTLHYTTLHYTTLHYITYTYIYIIYICVCVLQSQVLTGKCRHDKTKLQKRRNKAKQDEMGK